MRENRSMPACTVIPELAYPDVEKAIAWLCAAFGFTLRLQIGSHRAQLNVGDGAVVLVALPDHGGQGTAADVSHAHSVMVRVEDAAQHYERARLYGAQIVSPLADYPYGERQCTVKDLAGRAWTFSQSLADIDPEDWGGTPVA